MPIIAHKNRQPVSLTLHSSTNRLDRTWKKSPEQQQLKPQPQDKQQASNYVICPLSGLTYTVHDSYMAGWSMHHPHPLSYTLEPDVTFPPLILLARTKGGELPKDYLAAATLLVLHENSLLENAHAEPQYTRGAIVQQLCSQYTHYQLTQLFWIVFNSKATLKRQPIRLNLATAAESPNSLYYQIESIGKQALEAEDLPQTARQAGRTRKGKKSPKDLSLAQGKQDPVSARKRVESYTTKIAKALIAEEALDNPLKSYQIARAKLQDYVDLHPVTKGRVIVLYKELRDKAIGYKVIPRDGALDKSLEIMIRLLESEVAPLTDYEDF